MIGLGNIGGPVAANLVADEHDVTVYDVHQARADLIGGALHAQDVGTVGATCEITLLSLPSPAVVDTVAADWASSAAPGSILVDLSTNDPSAVRALGARLEGLGHHLVEAPLSGGVVGAEQRSLMFMLGGADDCVERVKPVLEPLGRATFHLGALGTANTMKLVSSLVVFTATWSSLEGLALARKAGIPVQTAVEVLRSDGVEHPYLEHLVDEIDLRDRPTRFALDLAAKDAELIVRTGAELGMPTPTGEALRGVLDAAVRGGLGGKDWADLVAVAEMLTGTDLRLHTDRPASS
jgi:3-hydroxyisobutyrate dehydrogenase